MFLDHIKERIYDIRNSVSNIEGNNNEHRKISLCLDRILDSLIDIVNELNNIKNDIDNPHLD